MSFTIRRATNEDKPDWLRLRQKLWPEAPIEYLNFDLDDKLTNVDYAVFWFRRTGIGAFIETGSTASEGCETLPQAISKHGTGRVNSG
jgi:hypothetical protein